MIRPILCFGLVAACAIFAGCAATPEASTPEASTPETPPVAGAPQAQPVPAPPPAATSAPETPPAPPPLSTLPPEQRRQAERATLQALNKVLAPARGSREKMRKALSIPSHMTSRTERYLSERMIDAFSDPRFVDRIVANMSDTQVLAVQGHPSLALEVAGNVIGKAQNFGFSNLDIAQQKALLQVFGAIYGAATTEECSGINDHKGSEIDRTNAMMAVLDRLPEDDSRQFADLLILAMSQPPRPPSPPLTNQEHELVVLNITHYFDTQPEDVRARLQQYYHGTKLPSDRCWSISKIADAILSGDEELSALGTRMFVQQMAAGANRAAGQ